MVGISDLVVLESALDEGFEHHIQSDSMVFSVDLAVVAEAEERLVDMVLSLTPAPAEEAVVS